LALTGVIAFGLLLGSSGVGFAGDRGRCFSVLIDEPFTTPDGASHTPGKLTLCKGMTHSPVSSLHHTYKDGLAVAMLMSRHGTSEGIPEDGRPFVMLNRDRGGLLHLAGYAVPDRGRMVTYRLDLARVEQERRMAKSGEPAPSSAAGSPLVLLAARTD
jgi:hypothetical protein